MPESEKIKILKDKPSLNEVLAEWKGPSHPYKKRSRIYYQTVSAITLLCSVIVYFLFHDVLLIGVILSIAFVVYVMSKMPPVDVEHKVIPAGFENVGKLYPWGMLYSFWFEKKLNDEVLVIQTRLPYPGQIRAVVRGIDTEELKKIIGKYLPFSDKPEKGWVDKVSDWFSKKFPLETTA